MDNVKASLHCELRGNDEKGSQNSQISFMDFTNNMHFLLFSNQDGLKVYREWNSWGYDSRFFSAVDKQDPSKHYLIERQGMAWTENYPETHTLNKGEFIVSDVHLCDTIWHITPKLPRNASAQLVLTPHFQIKSDKDVLKNGVWAGHIQGPSKEIFIEKSCVEKLNKP